jgi:potassium-transporting ATPase KdpC subunit
MKLLIQATKLFLVMTIITGILYPLGLTLFAEKIFPRQAEGSLLGDVGSELIGQKFEKAFYFWSRPSSVDYNPIPSGASNLGPTSQDLLKQINDRRNKFGSLAVPQDLLTSSGSGLDPHISPEAAQLQVDRVAAARNIGPDDKIKLLSLVDSLTERRDFGVLGEPKVNVLKLNLALDKIFARPR